MTDRTLRLRAGRAAPPGTRRGELALLRSGRLARAGGSVRAEQPITGRTAPPAPVPSCGDASWEGLARMFVLAPREALLSREIGSGRVGGTARTLPAAAVPPAPGQGAPAVEGAAVSADLAAGLAKSGGPPNGGAVTAEPSLPSSEEVGRSVPMGAATDLSAEGRIVTEIRLRGAVGAIDGMTPTQLSTTVPVPASHDDAMALGRERAAETLAKGAAGLMGEQPQ